MAKKQETIDENQGKPEKAPKEGKQKKITLGDYKKAETALKAELDKRKNSNFRKHHEMMWAVVDRQVSLEPPEVDKSSSEDGWLNSFELGILAQASEMMTGDILRLAFPDSRSWFDAHVEIPTELDVETGNKTPADKKIQAALDGRVRAMMTQQHTDFGLRDRVELSVKEALHHGAFVAEVDEGTMDMYLTGTSIKEVSAPMWVPHSMWNCWPDPSPSLVGTNMYYTGGMFVRKYMPRHKFMEMAAVGEGWIKGALKKIPKQEHTINDNQTKDLELIYYWGDVVIPKSGDGMETTTEDMYFPNHKAILANGKMVYLDANVTPYPPIIYKGYEKMDVRDPYFLSPIIKQSPLQKITSILANEFVNGVQLHVRPPIVYDGNDPDFVVNGGPVIAPGSKTSTKGSANYKEMKIGDPAVALTGIQFGVQTMKESLGRPGINVGSRATAEEVNKKQADSEAGPQGFVSKLDDALRTFLYMQAAMNKAKKGFKYTYYSPEMDSPDFLRVEAKDLPETINFEVVGSKGILGEQKRHLAFGQVTGFVAGHPMFAPLLEPMEIVKKMYLDAGTKSPERFLKAEDGIPADIKQKLKEMDGVIQKLQSELKDEQTQTKVKTDKMQLDYKAKTEKLTAHSKAQDDNYKVKVATLESKHQQSVAKLQNDIEKIRSDAKAADDKNQLTAADLLAKLKLAQDTHDNKDKSEVLAQQIATDKAIAHMQGIVTEFEHKIEMLIALEKKEQEVGLSNGEKEKESKLSASLIAMHQEVMKSLEDVTKTLVAPKEVVRDEKGRMVGMKLKDSQLGE